jgi:hypothetical protein
VILWIHRIDRVLRPFYPVTPRLHFSLKHTTTVSKQCRMADSHMTTRRHQHQIVSYTSWCSCSDAGCHKCALLAPWRPSWTQATRHAEPSGSPRNRCFATPGILLLWFRALFALVFDFKTGMSRSIASRAESRLSDLGTTDPMPLGKGPEPARGSVGTVCCCLSTMCQCRWFTQLRHPFMQVC